MSNILEQTLATIVTGDHRAAAVFERYQLDFCCKGKRTLGDACVEKGLDGAEVVAALAVTSDGEIQKTMPFTEMTAEMLINHILTHHHFYVRQVMPQIYHHLEKVALKHGDRFPHMVEVFNLFAAVQEEMTHHMHKEEMVLFPAIKAREQSFKRHEGPGRESLIIANAVNVMEAEHDTAGTLLQKINDLTNRYQAPPGACTTFKVSLAELQTFEEDLHQHVHLENNILFPMAVGWTN